jgi:hypothetical protein
MSLELVISALLWTTFATLVSQFVAILLMWALGLPPRNLAREIVEIQNTAVGVVFFIVTLVTSLFVSLMSSSGFTPDPEFLESALWIIGGLVTASIYTVILFIIAHRLLSPKKGEGVYKYLRREIIDEQNAALALFLGGLAVAPFMAMMFQLL